VTLRDAIELRANRFHSGSLAGVDGGSVSLAGPGAASRAEVSFADGLFGVSSSLLHPDVASSTQAATVTTLAFTMPLLGSTQRCNAWAP
jgi:hypothetical protein